MTLFGAFLSDISYFLLKRVSNSVEKILILHLYACLSHAELKLKHYFSSVGYF